MMPDVSYLLFLNGQNYGPYPVMQLQQWLVSGQVAPTTVAWRAGMPGWQALNTLPEFATMQPASMAPPPPPPPIGS
jgi:hypothetical protein